MSDSEHFNDKKSANPMMNLVIERKILQPVEYEAFKRYVISIDPGRKKYFNEPMKNVTFYGNLMVDFMAKMIKSPTPPRPIIKIMKKVLDFIVESGNYDYILLRKNLIEYMNNPSTEPEKKKWLGYLLGVG